MTSRQRIEAALRREQTDRVPIIREDQRGYRIESREQNQNDVPEHAERMAQAKLEVNPTPRRQESRRRPACLRRRTSFGTLRVYNPVRARICREMLP